ncbi:ParA family protein [Geomesophilobacter sediminis]|uniref:ParA family protein n=1 Tax=Geomesophilobacter sediminis TaxID=2798584 RepID=A0A8J7IX29_9BACT|nr:ParA family protein [Geomesophilobacter sediminis]MBJ6724307.1 ParA family protein [Geomesophilobacter sediminis]
MAQVIGVVQVKGGVGRSTIATNLAAVLSLKQPTVLIDCDLPQGTSASWFTLRRSELEPKHLTLATASDHRELVQLVRELSERHRYLVIDAPPRLAEMTRAVMVLSTLALVPLGASAVEIWSTQDLLKTVEEARRFRPDIDVRLVWNRFRARTREGIEVSEAAHRELGLKELATRLGYRVSYSEALARGLSADEWLDPVARAEVLALAAEVKGILKGKAK